MVSRFWIVALVYLLVGSAHAVEKRVLEPNREEQEFQFTVFATLENYESRSEQITMETDRNGLKTLTLYAQFEDPESPEGDLDLLEEQIQCWQERNGEDGTIWHFCRFELFDDQRLAESLFYNEGVSHVFSDALHALWREHRETYRGMSASTAGDGDIFVEISPSKSYVGCRRANTSSTYIDLCYFFVQRDASPEVAAATFENIRIREPWLNYLEESFLLNDLELDSVRLRVGTDGACRLVVTYMPNEFSDQSGKRVVLQGIYEGQNFIETCQYHNVEIRNLDE